MESNNKNNNYGHGEQQLQKSARKRKLNELANDGHGQPTAEEGEQKEQRQTENLSKKNCGGQQGNDVLENLHLEGLTREDLIQFVQKQLTNQNEAQNKHLEAVKEAEENAKQQAKEMTTKMEELKRALLASQQKAEELTGEMANLNVEHHLDSAKQAEEFSKRIVQLEQEKAEINAELGKKMAEIEGMHKEIEEKSEELAEKAKENEALLLQLNQLTSHQHQIGVSMQTEKQMKIQLSLETWFDWLAFVPRHRLGQIIPMIGDRKFASIVQKFLHKYGEISIDHIQIVAPYEEDPSGHPRVRAWQKNHPLRFEMAEAQMPANIKNFKCFTLSYFDQSVLTYMQKFQQNGLLENVNLMFAKLSSKAILQRQQVLCHLLPLFTGIRSIEVSGSAQLVDFYDAGKSKGIYELYMKMMEKTRILALNSKDPGNLHATKIKLYCRWLYQPARADGKPRVLQLGSFYRDSARISVFIERINKDFQMATDPVSFFIRIILPKTFQPLENICLDNCKTKQRLVTKMEEANPKFKKLEELVLLISRYPLASTKKWIEENEKEVMNWDFRAQNGRRIYLSRELKVVPI